MITFHKYFMLSFLKIMPLFVKCSHNCKQFLIINIIILFWSSQVLSKMQQASTILNYWLDWIAIRLVLYIALINQMLIVVFYLKDSSFFVSFIRGFAISTYPLINYQQYSVALKNSWTCFRSVTQTILG